MLDLIKGEVPVGLCSWSKGSGAFASNLVMLKGNWYWVNNAHNTHSLLSVFTHLYVVFFSQIGDTIVAEYEKFILKKPLHTYLEKHTYNHTQESTCLINYMHPLNFMKIFQFLNY